MLLFVLLFCCKSLIFYVYILYLLGYSGIFTLVIDGYFVGSSEKIYRMLKTISTTLYLKIDGEF
jgi:hypothetical protein